MHRNRAVLVELDQKGGKCFFFFHFLTFLWSSHFSSWGLNYSGRVALRGVRIGGTLVISTSEPVITRTDSTAATRPYLKYSEGLVVCKRVSGSMFLLLLFVHYTQEESSIHQYKIKSVYSLPVSAG